MQAGGIDDPNTGGLLIMGVQVVMMRLHEVARDCTRLHEMLIMGVQVAMTFPRHFRDTSMGVQVVMTAVAVLLMDRAGRRALLLVSLAGMCFCAAAMGAFHLNAQRPTWLVPHLQSIESSVGSLPWVVWEERSG